MTTIEYVKCLTKDYHPTEDLIKEISKRVDKISLLTNEQLILKWLLRIDKGAALDADLNAAALKIETIRRI